MNVGLVTDFYYPWMAGPSVLIRNLGHGFCTRGHSVALLAPSPTGVPYWEDDGGMQVTRAHTVRSPVGFDLRLAPWPWREADEWLRRTQPDVVHIHHPFPLSAAILLLARRGGIPVVATNHTIPECSLYGIRNVPLLYSATGAALARWLVFLLDYCRSVATPTRTAAELLRGLGYRGSIEVISNGVDTARFRPGSRDHALRRRLGLDERPIVLYTGRLDAEKDMETWLTAAALLRRNLDVQFAVGGKGSERSRLEALSKALGLDDALRFIGYLDDEEFPEVYRLADLYLITSPVELQSIATLEAVSSGLPVVAVRAGALPELVGDGLNGFLAPVGAAEELADAAFKVLCDPLQARSFSAHSRSLALGHDLDQSIAGYERFLMEAVTARGGTRDSERSGFVWG